MLAVCNTRAQSLPAQPDKEPVVALKSNLLYVATTTLYLGVEVAVAPEWSVELSANYNPWTYGGGRKIKHWLLQPAVRYWTNRWGEGSFFGAHAHGGQFNVARIGGEGRYQGWLAGAGVSYGYRWNWSQSWGVEAEIGLGWAHLDYSKYATAGGECSRCGALTGRDTHNYFGVTKAAVSLIYTIGKK
jgi:hypothetical protein